MAKKFTMATEALNYASEANHVSKYIRQRIRKFQDQSVRQWLESCAMPTQVMTVKEPTRGALKWMSQMKLELAFLPVV